MTFEEQKIKYTNLYFGLGCVWKVEGLYQHLYAYGQYIGLSLYAPAGKSCTYFFGEKSTEVFAIDILPDMIPVLEEIALDNNIKI